MTHKKKIEYMRIAAGVAGYYFEEKGFDTLVSLYELVIEKEGNTDLRSIADVQQEVEERIAFQEKEKMITKLDEEKKVNE